MSCERCQDIHSAQLSGLSGKACECSCHGIAWTYPIVTCGDIDITGTVSSTLNLGDDNCCGNTCEDLNINN